MRATTPARVVAASAVGYLLGTVPSADVAARLATRGSTDLRDEGSGNPGAVNAIGVLGTGWGLGVMAADIAKGAAASVVGAAIKGRTRAEIETARDQLRAMLKSGGPAPDAPFDGLEVLLPARDYKNRHASIMLTLEAASEAMEQAEKAACA